jgi:hypothetical protein
MAILSAENWLMLIACTITLSYSFWLIGEAERQTK